MSRPQEMSPALRKALYGDNIIEEEEVSRATSPLVYIGLGWITAVGGSLFYSFRNYRHLAISHRIINARVYAQGATVAALGAVAAYQAIDNHFHHDKNVSQEIKRRESIGLPIQVEPEPEIRWKPSWIIKMFVGTDSMPPPKNESERLTMRKKVVIKSAVVGGMVWGAIGTAGVLIANKFVPLVQKATPAGKVFLCCAAFCCGFSIEGENEGLRFTRIYPQQE